MLEIDNILVALPMNSEQTRALEKQAPQANFTYAEEEIDEEAVKKADVIIGNIPIPLIKKAENLKWVQLIGSGAEGYRDKGILPEGTILSTATGAYGLPVAEHMFSIMLGLMKKLNLYRDNQLQSLWKCEGTVKSVSGATVLIIGLGDIGLEFAQRAKAFGGYIIGVRRTLGRKQECVDEIYTIDKLNDLLPRADVVMLSLPGTAETINLFNEKRIALMKAGSILLNCGRGSAIDSNAMINALKDGKIFAAGLDVTDIEPLPKEHELWQMKNVVITPHVGGGFYLPQVLDRVLKICTDNLGRVVNGKLPDSIIDFSTGYAQIKK